TRFSRDWSSDVCSSDLVVEGGNDQTLATTPVAERPVVALFQSAVPRTAGFSAIDVGDLHEETKWFTMGLMFIGGAAGSTAGGIRSEERRVGEGGGGRGS